MIALISSKHNKSAVLWEKLSGNKMKFGPCKYSIKVIQTLAHSLKSLLCTSYCISHHLFHCTSIMTNNECKILSFHNFSSQDLFWQFTNLWFLFLFIWAAWKLLKLCSLSLSLSLKSSLVMNLKSSMVLQLSMDHSTLTLTIHYPQAWDEL